MAEARSDLLDTRQAAEYLNVAHSTLEGWRVRGHGPRYLKLAHRVVRYRRAALDEWLSVREVASTSEADTLERQARGR